MIMIIASEALGGEAITEPYPIDCFPLEMSVRTFYVTLHSLAKANCFPTF